MTGVEHVSGPVLVGLLGVAVLGGLVLAAGMASGHGPDSHVGNADTVDSDAGAHTAGPSGQAAPPGDRSTAGASAPVLHGIIPSEFTFPAQAEPDGNRWLPHHGLWPLAFYVIGWYLWSPAGAPVLGASLVGLATLLLLDDWISHALGIETPASAAFKLLMRNRSFRRLYVRFWWMVYR